MLIRQHQLCHSFLRDFFSNFIKSLFGLKESPQPQNLNSSFLFKRFCWRSVWNVVAGKTVRIPDIFLRSPLVYSALFQNWQTKSKILKFKRFFKVLTLYLTAEDKSVIDLAPLTVFNTSSISTKYLFLLFLIEFKRPIHTKNYLF